MSEPLAIKAKGASIAPHRISENCNQLLRAGDVVIAMPVAEAVRNTAVKVEIGKPARLAFGSQRRRVRTLRIIRVVGCHLQHAQDILRALVSNDCLAPVAGKNRTLTGRSTIEAAHHLVGDREIVAGAPRPFCWVSYRYFSQMENGDARTYQRV